MKFDQLIEYRTGNTVFSLISTMSRISVGETSPRSFLRNQNSLDISRP